MPCKHRIRCTLLSFGVLLASGCGRAPVDVPAASTVPPPAVAAAKKPDARAIAAAAAKNKPDAEGYRELDWLEMLPEGDLDAPQAPVNHDGSMRAQQSGSSKTVATLNGQKVKLPGYVVPVETNDNGEMTEFFFVPYYGACIHVPPPPPNQILYVRLKHGVKQPAIWDPYWVKGIINIAPFSNDTAATAYTLDADNLLPYQ